MIQEFRVLCMDGTDRVSHIVLVRREMRVHVTFIINA
ncbi:predicted protein [Histoplasma mississippiense (nom. inval.)]|nr:predicted protein [Histoplasma mississippiense (nom. inval.)]EDN09330.1 predicted protein [Histoplasma mississippiense (nom. inval.)]